MNEKSALRLTQLFDAGYVLLISAGPYVTGPVRSIGKLDYEDDDSPYVYSDDHHEDRPLSHVYVEEVQVLQPVDWLNPGIWDDICNGGEPMSVDGEYFTDHEDDIHPAENEPYPEMLKELETEFEVRDCLAGDVTGDYKGQLKEAEARGYTFTQELYDEAWSNTENP